MTHEVLVTDIKFNTMGEILSRLGGTLTATSAIITILTALFIFRDWEDSILNSVKLAAQESSPNDIDQDVVKEIVSYSGIYSLYERCEDHDKRFEIA